jgi:hypothetical protein
LERGYRLSRATDHQNAIDIFLQCMADAYATGNWQHDIHHHRYERSGEEVKYCDGGKRQQA